MAEVQQQPVAPVTATEPVTSAVTAPEPTTALPQTTPAVTEPVIAPAAESKADETVPAAVETPAVKEDVAEQKVVEPITEGQLGYKGPGLLKSLIPSKKEFWLSDAPVSPQGLDSYLRGEKPEVSYPVVAWASQTGKGLLFFNKKGHTNREHPHGVLALYDATDLKKQPTHEITLNLYGHAHTLKAANDAERDGWFISLEKAIELGKVEKDSLRETEGYKAEIEKLNKPTAPGASLATTSVIQPPGPNAKKSAEIDRVQRPDSDVEEETKKAHKSRSTSRGLLSRLTGKKEEHDAKKEEKELKKAEDPVVAPIAPVEPVAPVAPVVPVSADSNAVEGLAEVAPAGVVAGEAAVEEKPKTSKRNSIFGWAGIKSPAREKDAKEAELKPEVPVKDETAPQIPETVTTEPTAEPAVAAVPAVETPKDAEAASPTTQKSGFLSNLGFGKRTRSVSPSAQPQEAIKKDETVEAAPVTEATVTEPVVEPATEAIAPVDATADEAAKTDGAPTSKRNSVFGSLGRRASKALNRIQAPKKEGAAATTDETAKEEGSAVAATSTEAEKPLAEPTAVTETAPVDATAQSSIGDVVPEAVNVGQPQTHAPVTTTV